MQTKGHKEWRGHPYALYLRGRPRNWNPYHHIRMLHAIGVCIAMNDGGYAVLGLSLASSFELFQTDFRGLFGKVRNKS